MLELLKIQLQHGTIDNKMSGFKPGHTDNNYVRFPAGLRVFFIYPCTIVILAQIFFFCCTSL